jgi:hypothetical protein
MSKAFICVDERAAPPRRRLHLQHRRLDLEVAAPVERVAQRADDAGAHPDRVARRRPHDEVDVPLPDPRLLGQVLVQHRERRSALAASCQPVAITDSSPRARRDHLAGRRHDVAEVDVGLERRERVGADLGLRHHQLQPRAVAVLERGEAEPARRPQEDDAAGDGHGLAAALARGQALVRRAHLRQRVRPADVDRVRLGPGGQQALPLLPPDPQLLGQVVGDVGGVAAARHSQASRVGVDRRAVPPGSGGTARGLGPGYTALDVEDADAPRADQQTDR